MRNGGSVWYDGPPAATGPLRNSVLHAVRAGDGIDQPYAPMLMGRSIEPPLAPSTPMFPGRPRQNLARKRSPPTPTGARARTDNRVGRHQGPPTASAPFTRNNNNQIQARKSRQASTRR